MSMKHFENDENTAEYSLSDRSTAYSLEMWNAIEAAAADDARWLRENGPRLRAEREAEVAARQAARAATRSA